MSEISLSAEKHKRILLVGLTKDQNLGDPIICECVEYIIRCLDPDVIVDYGCVDEYDHKRWLVVRIFSKLQRKFNLPPSKLLDLLYKRYFKKKLKGFDLAIVVGGGLFKFKNQYFNGLIGLVEAAEEAQVPVAFNSIGVEDYDPDNYKCRRLKKIMHNPSVKFISTRDDYATLCNKYFDNKPACRLELSVAPGIMSEDAYIVKAAKENIIGIGVCRFSIFKEYGNKQTSDEIENIYYDVIKKLVDKNYTVELFTNGAPSDAKAVETLKKRLHNNNINVKVELPTTTERLVNILARYSLIIAARMHSCIVGYSLGIPVIGLVWNKKQLHWANIIKQTESFLCYDAINTENIVTKAETLYGSSNPDPERKSELKGVLFKQIDTILGLKFHN